MNKIHYALTYYYSLIRGKVVSILLLAGFTAVIAAAPVLAATGTPYGSGAYDSSVYSGTAASTSTVGTPNTGAGMYSPDQTSTKPSHTVNRYELGVGVVLLSAGVAGLFASAKRKKRG